MSSSCTISGAPCPAADLEERPEGRPVDRPPDLSGRLMDVDLAPAPVPAARQVLLELPRRVGGQRIRHRRHRDHAFRVALRGPGDPGAVVLLDAAHPEEGDPRDPVAVHRRDQGLDRIRPVEMRVGVDERARVGRRAPGARPREPAERERAQEGSAARRCSRTRPEPTGRPGGVSNASAPALRARHPAILGSYGLCPHPRPGRDPPAGRRARPGLRLGVLAGEGPQGGVSDRVRAGLRRRGVARARRSPRPTAGPASA